MKDKIIQILNDYRENVSNDSSVDNYAIKERDFKELVNELVEKLVITGVSKSFTAEEIIEELEGEENIYDAIKYFKSLK